MATHWGNEGVVKVGSVTVAEVTAFSFTEKVTPIDDTSMGDAYRTHIAGSGIKEWSGTIECHWDETDATGQGALTVGASVTLNLYSEGATTGDKYFTGTASITERSQDQKMDGDTIKCSFSFLGSGALTVATAP